MSLSMGTGDFGRPSTVATPYVGVLPSIPSTRVPLPPLVGSSVVTIVAVVAAVCGMIVICIRFCVLIDDMLTRISQQNL